MKVSRAILLFVSCLGLPGVPRAAAQSSCDALEVLPPHSVAHGKTVAEWAAEWWRWVLSIPEAENPLFDKTGERCGVQQTDSGRFESDPDLCKVFFLADTWRSSVHESDVRVVRDRCVVPYGRALFFPLFTHVAFIPLPCAPNCPDESALRKLCQSDLKQHVNKIQFACTIDDCPFTGLSAYDEGEDCTTVELDLAPGNFVGLATGRYRVIASGIWLMVEPLQPGLHRIHFEGLVDPFIDENGEETCVYCQRVTYVIRVEDPRFRRGDVDGGGIADISDPIYLLTWLFLEGEKPPCPDAADVEDDGKVDLTDAVYLINWLFLGGALPGDPGPFECGVDPTSDGLDPCKPTTDGLDSCNPSCE